jgi:hypothetical protein
MGRKLDATEIKIMAARMADVPPDDVEGYVLIVSNDSDIIRTISNATGEATAIGVMARAIEYLARDIAEARAAQ